MYLYLYANCLIINYCLQAEFNIFLGPRPHRNNWFLLNQKFLKHFCPLQNVGGNHEKRLFSCDHENSLFLGDTKQFPE